MLPRDSGFSRAAAVLRFRIVLPVRFGENLPQRLAAIDNLLAAAFWALIFAHVAAGEGGALDLVHLNGAVGASGIAHGGKCSLTWKNKMLTADKR